MTSGVGEGVEVGGRSVGVEVIVGSAVSVGSAVELGAGVSVGTGEGKAVMVASAVLVARVSIVGSGLATLSNICGLQAPKASAMSNNSATLVFTIQSPPNLISFFSDQLLGDRWHSIPEVCPKSVQKACQNGVARMRPVQLL